MRMTNNLKDIRKNDVEIFFAVDDTYLPIMAPAILSLGEKADPKRVYNIRVLHTGVNEEYKKMILESLTRKNIRIEFIDISKDITQIFEKLHTRDYFSRTTYYRLFIPGLFPNIDKALYIDCDIILNEDIGKLYDVEIGDNLVGAIPDAFVNSNGPLTNYAESRVGVDCVRHYFNAGILVMNLKEMRKWDTETLFKNLLDAVTFNIAQDQDYLNVMCRGRVHYISDTWNYMPIDGRVRIDCPNLIHYNLHYKPWHTDGVDFSDLFHHYANRTLFAEIIKEIRKNYTDLDRKNAMIATNRLVTMAVEQAEAKEENRILSEKFEQILSNTFKTKGYAL